jgi:hypothetical protein
MANNDDAEKQTDDPSAAVEPFVKELCKLDWYNIWENFKRTLDEQRKQYRWWQIVGNAFNFVVKKILDNCLLCAIFITLLVLCGLAIIVLYIVYKHLSTDDDCILK